jgi:hypothetical protein
MMCQVPPTYEKHMNHNSKIKLIGIMSWVVTYKEIRHPIRLIDQYSHIENLPLE